METSVERSWREYQALPDKEWRKDFFDPLSGGFVATHVLKAKDDMRLTGILAEIEACLRLAIEGKRVLRLPENVLNNLDRIKIQGLPYKDLLKFKQGQDKPKGYPDAYFDGQTWDFKAPKSFNNESIRQMIRNGRKADNVVFVIAKPEYILEIQTAIGREYGNRLKDGSWSDLPDVFGVMEGALFLIWRKPK